MLQYINIVRDMVSLVKSININETYNDDKAAAEVSDTVRYQYGINRYFCYYYDCILIEIKATEIYNKLKIRLVINIF